MRGTYSRQTVIDLVDASWAKDRDACVLWPGTVTKKGKPYVGPEVCHRISWKHFKGSDPGRAWVRQSCGHKLCINPEHLIMQETKPVVPAIARRDPSPRIEGDIAFVPLTGGYEAIIDVDDVELVGQFRWFADMKYGGPRPVRDRKIGERVDGGSRKQSLYRMLMNPPPDMEIDHINGNPLDNRRSNLRICTHAENMRNRKIAPGKVKGVQKRSGRYHASIRACGVTRYLGDFKTVKQAADAYDAAAREFHGEFASLNNYAEPDVTIDMGTVT